jgi:hypothetical protein
VALVGVAAHFAADPSSSSLTPVVAGAGLLGADLCVRDRRRLAPGPKAETDGRYPYVRISKAGNLGVGLRDPERNPAPRYRKDLVPLPANTGHEALLFLSFFWRVSFQPIVAAYF